MPPDLAADRGEAPRWVYPLDGYFAVPFALPADLVAAVAASDQGATSDESAPQYGPRLAVQMRMPWRQMEQRPTLPGDPPIGIINFATLPPAPPPVVSVQVLNHALFNVIGPSVIAGNAATLPADAAADSADWDGAATIRLSDAQSRRVCQEAAAPPVYVAVYANNPEYLLGVRPDSGAAGGGGARARRRRGVAADVQAGLRAGAGAQGRRPRQTCWRGRTWATTARGWPGRPPTCRCRRACWRSAAWT